MLTALSLLAAFANQAGLDPAQLSVGDPIVLSGMLFGAMLPFLFAALTMISVGKAAAEIIEEVRRQFREVTNARGDTLMDAIKLASEGKAIPPEQARDRRARAARRAPRARKNARARSGPSDGPRTRRARRTSRPRATAASRSRRARRCARRASPLSPPGVCVSAPNLTAIARARTARSRALGQVREMVAPGAYAILAPLFVGFFVGPRCLMGVNAGAIASGCMMAIMMSNAGGAWDNGKKLCEKLKIKKTDQGKACIVGDTVRRHARRRVARARFCPSLSRVKLRPDI